MKIIIAGMALGLFVAAAQGAEIDGPLSPAPAQDGATTSIRNISPAELAAVLDPVMEQGMREENIPGAAIAFVRDGKLLWAKGYGVTEVATKAPVSTVNTRWPFASITKVLTATAVMQLVERGRMQLDADVNDYLKTLRVPANFPAPVTVADLLRHTDGLDELPGRLAATKDAVRPLREFLDGRLLRVAPPGGVTRYGSYGIALAGAAVEDVSGLTYDAYVDEEIFEPLGMHRSSIGYPENVASSLATPYMEREGQLQAIPFEWYHTTPTSSLYSTIEDMARFAASHLAGPQDAPRILGAASIREMQFQQATVHPKIPGWSYGWQLDDANGLRILEHGGDVGGFASLLVLLPDQNAGFVIVHHIEGSNLRFDVKREILGHLFQERARPSQPPVPVLASQDRTRQFAGIFLANNYCRSCPDGAAGAQRFEVSALPDGTLRLWDTRWIETEPLLFVSEDGKRRIGFRKDEADKVIAISAGSWKVLERAPE